MALVTICDNCYAEWLVDQFVYVEAVEKNLCPVCINQLVDLCYSRLSNKVIRKVEEELEEL